MREVLPSASRHVAMAFVDVPGPVHGIEAQPYHRITFNIGPSYAADASSERFMQAMVFTRHALMVIPPDEAFTHHAANPQHRSRRSKPGRLVTFRISRELFQQAAMSLGISHRDARLAHQIVPTDEVLRLSAQLLMADLQGGSPDGAAATERAATALVCRLLQRAGQARAATAPGPMEKVQAHIDSHIDNPSDSHPGEPLTLEHLADVAGMSVFHFCRVFRDHLGATPHQYILARRMERARQLLWANDGRSVLDIALACGFSSSSHFSAQFKRHTGKTPLQWQRHAAAGARAEGLR